MDDEAVNDLAEERDRQHELAERALRQHDTSTFHKAATEFHRLAGIVGYP